MTGNINPAAEPDIVVPAGIVEKTPLGKSAWLPGRQEAIDIILGVSAFFVERIEGVFQIGVELIA